MILIGWWMLKPSSTFFVVDNRSMYPFIYFVPCHNNILIFNIVQYYWYLVSIQWVNLGTFGESTSYNKHKYVKHRIVMYSSRQYSIIVVVARGLKLS